MDPHRADSDRPRHDQGGRAVGREVKGPEVVRREITTRYAYNLEQSVPDIRPSHRFDVTSQGTAPTAFICAFEPTSLEDAVRNDVSLGGDADTLAAIAGGLGDALHGLPEGFVRTAGDRYFQDVEDITGALDALYERENPDEASEVQDRPPEQARRCRNITHDRSVRASREAREG